MKQFLILLLLSAAGWSQTAPADIAGNALRQQEANQKASAQTANAALLRQQTALLKEQTEAIQQQNELLKRAAQAPTTFIPALRKPRIDDIDASTGQPRFATYAEYEDAKDEWLIEETLRRCGALHSAKR